MPSLDFETEKADFRQYYDTNHAMLVYAKESFITLVNALVTNDGSIAIKEIEGRVKEKEECIKKFNQKYRQQLETDQTPYSIKDHISDLLGLRIICLYEDQIEHINKIIAEHFEIIQITDKSAALENTDGSFGYKGLHMDIRQGPERRAMPEYARLADLNFELQIRTIIQDSWSVLDHKIQYKKSIPPKLKRRINTLAALFELADREFREIREATQVELQKAQDEPDEPEVINQVQEPVTSHLPSTASSTDELNAFTFLKIAQHFFHDFVFEAHKVDGFVEEIVTSEPGITRAIFNKYMKHNIAKVKRYQTYFEHKFPDTLYPYTVIRHCLYLGEPAFFSKMLTNIARERFEEWLNTPAIEG